MNIPLLKFQSFVRGISFWANTIPYKPLLPTGDSSPYFGHYEGQRYGPFDTNNCWNFSACELAETRLEMMEKMGLIPTGTLDWAKKAGYKDSEGDWYFSRRWEGVLSGVRDTGNMQIAFWQLASVAGLIPNAMLPYGSAEALRFQTKDQFNTDYFNPNLITADMERMGIDFLKHFRIRAENITGGLLHEIADELDKYLKEGSLQIGHPVPQDGTWNQQYVKWPQGRYQADHATELYKFDRNDPFPYYDYDSYQPNLKRLSGDYYIPFITRVSIEPL